MGQLTRLAPADVAEAARRFGLGAPGACEGIAAGTINSNYRLAAGGRAWFLRVNEGKTEDEVAYEAELVAHLAARGVPTPRPVPADDGRPFAATAAGLVTVFPWVAGAHRAPAEICAEDARAAGAALARLHAAGAGFPGRRASRYAFARIVERWERLRGLAADGKDPALAAAVADVGDEIAWLEARAAARAALPAGVIHGDLFPDNVLFVDGRGPRLAALLDFEQASDGSLAYDLAVCLCAWCFADGFEPARLRAMAEGYQAVRPLAPAERELLYTEARAAAMRFTVTRITDVHLDAEATPVVRQAKDFRRYHARLRALRQLGPEGFGELLGR